MLPIRAGEACGDSFPVFPEDLRGRGRSPGGLHPPSTLSALSARALTARPKATLGVVEGVAASLQGGWPASGSALSAGSWNHRPVFRLKKERKKSRVLRLQSCARLGATSAPVAREVCEDFCEVSSFSSSVSFSSLPSSDQHQIQ